MTCKKYFYLCIAIIWLWQDKTVVSDVKSFFSIQKHLLKTQTSFIGLFVFSPFLYVFFLLIKVRLMKTPQKVLKKVKVSGKMFLQALFAYFSLQSCFLLPRLKINSLWHILHIQPFFWKVQSTLSIICVS